MRHKSISLAFVSSLAFLVLAIASATPAAAQYGPQPPSPPPPPQGGYYGPQPGPGYYPPPPPPGVQRRGFTIGFGFGLGSFGCDDVCIINSDDRFGGGVFELHLGGSVTPQIAVLFDVWAIGSALNEYQSLGHAIASVGLRYFVHPKVWLQGGLGWSSLSVSDSRCDPGDNNCDGQIGDSGGAVMVAAGVELYQTYSFALDLSVRAGLGSYEEGSINMSSVQLGFNWY